MPIPPTPRLESLTLDAGDIALTAIRQHLPDTEQADKLLCLHGWLDNAASFLPLMPYLPNLEVVAIDMPGHGHSDHLAGDYSLVSLARYAAEAAKALGWQRYHLAGHSLGGCIAPMLAVAQPEAVQSLILIEASGPLSEPASLFPARLEKAIADRLNPERFASRRIDNLDDAIATRLRANTMHHPSARLIVERQLIKHADGSYRWRFDPTLRMNSTLYLTEAHVEAVLQAVPCRTLTIVGRDGYLTGRDSTDTRFACLADHHPVVLAGHHHLHMDTPEPVASAINFFLGTVPALGG